MVTVEVVDDTSAYEDDVRQLLVKYDDEFVPPLSSRDSTVQTEGLSHSPAERAIDAYLESCLNQNLLIATDGGEVIAFLSYRVTSEKEGLEAYSPCVYVSTTIVEDDYREQGVATALNRRLLDAIVPDLPVEYVTRRTWSTNTASMAYIESLGFNVAKVVEDDRGEGIDSIYYYKAV